jgi:uncharacterized protein YjbI with pentapeptide repeats
MNNQEKNGFSSKWAEVSISDLSGLNLIGKDLRDKDFSNANLKWANLNWSNLTRTNLSGANLSKANLTGANLTRANLTETILNNANLNNAILTEVDLRRGSLSKANLSEANFSKANFTSAILNRADLKEADLSGSILTEADLREANLTEAILDDANLSGADLTGARVISTNLVGAKITGACLYGSARDDWIIDDIKCDYIFWDSEKKVRMPENRSFHDGEFEKLYKQLPTFEYIFKNGCNPIDMLIIDHIVQDIREKFSDFHLQVDSIQFRTNPRVIFTVSLIEYIEKASQLVKLGYEERISKLENNFHILRDKFDKMMKLFSEQEPIMGDTYHVTESLVSIVGKDASVEGDINLKQVSFESISNIDLNELAKQLSKLRSEIEKNIENPQADNLAAKVARAEIEAKDGKHSNALECLKKAGIEAWEISKKVGIPLATKAFEIALNIGSK